MHIIKIITGIRRCGKSTLLEIYRDKLAGYDVKPAQIQFINMEDPKNRHLLNWEDLYDKIDSSLLPDKMNYIFIDEIQNVAEFEKAVDGLFIKKNVDLYITGSNAYFLSSEIATILSGRYVEIKMLPLSFAEYASAFPDQPRTDLLFEQYLNNGSFPQTVELYKNNSASAAHEYLRGIYSTVLYKDIAQRLNADNNKLGVVANFMFDNISKITSPKKITDTIASDGYKMSRNTVEGYLKSLSESFILYQVGRYEVKGKKLLQTLGKYYVVDSGLRNIMLGVDALTDYGHLLENIICLELLRRNDNVWIGKVGDKEVDFVVRSKSGAIEYFQVTASMLDENTKSRELASLQNIQDNNAKFILTMDVGERNYDGIRQVNLIDWLLN
jgi:predicted AAA+ superfamily ATPase